MVKNSEEYFLFRKKERINEYLNLGSVYRTCQRIEQIARWTHVDYSECTHSIINLIDQELEIRMSDKEEILELRDKCALLAEIIKTNLTSTNLYSSIDLILLIEQIERLTKVLVSNKFSLFSFEIYTFSLYRPVILIV